MNKKNYKIGDEVSIFLRNSLGEKKKLRGTIKKIEQHFGRKTYTITGAVAEDLRTRKITG